MNKAGKLAGEWGPGVLLTLGTLWVLQGAIAKTSSHGVIVHGINYNAGTVKSGTVISHDVRMVNLSTLPVTIEPQPGCGCTSVKMSSELLPPLHASLMTVKVDTHHAILGWQREGVMVTFTSGNKTWQTLSTVEFSSH